MRRYAAVFLVLAVPAGILFHQTVFAQDTAADICNSVFGSEASALMVAFNAQKLDDAETCNAYKFLLERNGSGSVGVTPGCYRTQKDRILKLNPGFAVSLYRALSEIEKQYGGRNIVQSGYRCSSVSHSSGCAADIIWASCSQKYPGNTTAAWRCSSDHYNASTNSWSQPEQQWIDANGKSDRYKIHLRFRGAPEGHHVEPIDTKGCRTGAAVATSNTTPSSGIANTMRSVLGMQPAQQAVPAQQAIASQPIAAAQSPLSSFNAMPTALVSDTLVNTGSLATTSSIADRLEELAFGIRATSTQSATSVPLVINPNDVAAITSTNNQQTNATTSGLGGAITQSTFVSSDLAGQPYAPAPQNTMVRILSQLKTVLLKLLDYLQPFRKNAAHPEHEEELDY